MNRYNTPDAYTSIIAPPGTEVGDQKRDQFIAAMLSIMGDTRLFWLPKISDTTATTGVSSGVRTFTYDGTVAGNLSALGSGVSWKLDGTADEVDTPDTANMSFVNGVTDEPFSIVSIFRVTDATSSTILAKNDVGSTLREYLFYLDSSDRPQFFIYDETANAQIARVDSTTWNENEWGLLVGSYDGSGVSSGISIFGATETTLAFGRLDSGNNDSGSYVSMVDTTALPLIGASNNTAPGTFMDGDMAMVAVCAKQLLIDDAWEIKNVSNGFFNLDM